MNVPIASQERLCRVADLADRTSASMRTMATVVTWKLPLPWRREERWKGSISALDLGVTGRSRGLVTLTKQLTALAEMHS